MAMLALLPACSQDEAMVAEPERIGFMTLNMSINARALTNGNETQGYIGQVSIWIYGGTARNASPMVYKVYDQLNWQKHDNATPGDVEYTALIPEKVELDTRDGMTTEPLRVYVMVNANKATWPGDMPFSTITEDALQAAYFSAVEQQAKDNEVLMFGQGQLQGPITVNAYHEMQVNVSRCMAKLELYFTQRTADVNLNIKEVSLSQIPDKGFLTTPANWDNVSMDYSQSRTMFSNAAGQNISSVLTADWENGYFSSAYASDGGTFTPLEITAPYLLERNGMAWTATMQDEIYPDNAPETLSASYVLTLKYDYSQLGVMTEMTKQLALSKIERNTRYRIFIRVHTDTKVEVNTKTIKWIEGTGKITIDSTTDLEDEGFVKK